MRKSKLLATVISLLLVVCILCANCAVFAANNLIIMDGGDLWDDTGEEIPEDGTTPPAGGEDQGGTTTPPAGGEDQGGTTTPPAGGETPDGGEGEGEGGTTTPPGGGTTPPGGGTTPPTGGTRPPSSGGTSSKDDTSDKEETDEQAGTTEPVYKDFSDVKETDWYYEDVRTLAGLGVVDGYTDGTFLPAGNVTRAEFVKMLVEVVSGGQSFTSYEKQFEDVELDAWYNKYIVNAILFGIIDKKDYGEKFEPDKAITRREAAKMIVNALGLTTGGFKSPFVDVQEDNITALYGACIMQGSVINGERLFYPDTNITRAESAAVILRTVKYAIDEEAYKKEFKEKYPVPELEVLYTVPETALEFYNEFANAWGNSQAFLMFDYNYGVNSDDMRRVTEACMAAFRKAAEYNPELGTYLYINAETKGTTSKCTLKISFTSNEETLSTEVLFENASVAKAKARELVATVTASCTTDLEKADAIHDYLAKNIEYDHSFAPVSYTAYGALEKGLAVCHGYSGAFNLMCHAAGLKAVAVANSEHMWNIVLADGKMYHYDVTFDDADGKVLDTYKGIVHNKFVPDKDHMSFVLPAEEYFR